MTEKEENNQVNEPQASYNIEGGKIRIFSSHAEQAEYDLKQMAMRTHKQSLELLEQLRLLFLKEHLLPNGEWESIDTIITLTDSKTNTP